MQEAAFLGITNTGWVAATAIATAILACITLLSLRFIASQVGVSATQAGESRKAHVETLIESFVREYTNFRRELFLTDVKRHVRESLNWEDLGSLRMLAVRCELFLPSVRMMIRVGSDERAGQIRRMYMQDVGVISDLLVYAQTNMDEHRQTARASFISRSLADLKDCGASDEEIARAAELMERGEFETQNKEYAIIRRRRQLALGMTPEQMIEQDKKANAETKSDAVLIGKKFGLAYNEAALSAYWQSEFESIVKAIAKLKKVVHDELKGAAHA